MASTPQPRPVPKLNIKRPRTTAQQEQDECWIGDGPAPDIRKRKIYLLYQLSQEGQKEAFLTTQLTPYDDVDVITAYCGRTCKRELEYTDDEYKDAFELVWMSPEGIAYVFVGGREAFRQSDGGGWKGNDTAPGPWKVAFDPKYKACAIRHIVQPQVPVLMFDSARPSTHDLLDAERLRRYTIEKSKDKAWQERKKAEEQDWEETNRRLEIFSRR